MKKKIFSYLKKTAPFTLVSVAVVVFLCALIFHTPKPLQNWPRQRSNQISRNLTHILATNLFANLQKNEPFQLRLSEDNINEMLSHAGYPEKQNDTVIHQPRVILLERTLVCMVNMDYKGLKFSVTAEIVPFLNKDGLLEIDISKVRIGALPVTFLAKKVYSDRYANHSANPAKQNWQKKLEKALFTDTPVEPVLEIYQRRIRITSVRITDGNIKVEFAPVNF